MHLQGSPGTQREPSQRTLVSWLWRETLCLQEKELRLEATEGLRQLGKKPKVCVVGSGMKPPGQCPDVRTPAEKGARFTGLWAMQESPAERRGWLINQRKDDV